MSMQTSIKHARFELSNIFRHPEQLLLLIGTPVALLTMLPNQKLILEFTIGACAMASSFTSIAINTAFSRRYGTLKYLAVTPLGLRGLVIGQSLVGLSLLIVQLPVVYVTRLLTGFPPSTSFSIWFLLPLLLIFFTQLAFLFASVLSAEKVLAFANIVFILAMVSGFKLLPTDWSMFHPLSAFASGNENFPAALAALLVLNAATNILLRKNFRWLD